ncbi:MAG: response regulator [Draconibacterium sp.]
MNIKKSLLIYVVEDNKIYNRLICEYLKKQDYTNVKSFESGKECMKAVKNGEKPDIVIEDYHLQDSTGIDVLLFVKKHSASSEFIFLTANDSVEVAVNSIKYGAYDYVIKDNDVALKKVGDKIHKITKMLLLNKRNKVIQKLMIATILVLFLIVVLGILQVFFQIFGPIR